LKNSLICNILGLRVGFRLNRQNKLEIPLLKRYKRLTINILKIALFSIDTLLRLSCNGNILSIDPIFWLLSKRTLINLLLSTHWLPCPNQMSPFEVKKLKKRLLSFNILLMVAKPVFIHCFLEKKLMDPIQIPSQWENQIYDSLSPIIIFKVILDILGAFLITKVKKFQICWEVQK